MGSSGRIMFIGSLSTALVCCIYGLGVASSRGIGTRVSPPVSSPALNKELEGIMYSWIIPRLIRKYAQPFKQVEVDAEEPVVEETMKPFGSEHTDHRYAHPNLRGKRRDNTFFPFPASFMEKFTKAREARSSPVTMEKVQEVVLPWEMKYFSPMLRG